MKFIFIELGYALLLSIRDILPILGLILFFQLFVLREKIRRKGRLAAGFIFCALGLGLFLAGLRKALFPIGEIMARQLSEPAFVAGSSGLGQEPAWWAYGWMYLFGAMIGFSTTIAEPALMAIGIKAEEVSKGSIRQWPLRIAVALGVGAGIVVGLFRIITGAPLVYFIAAGYIVIIMQTMFAPRYIIPLAYDSGGVTTSLVTVPLIVALGLGLSQSLPGRNPALDGFGLVAFASLFPIMSVMGTIQCAHWRDRLKCRQQLKKGRS